MVVASPSLADSEGGATSPHVVVMKQMHFDPPQITVQKGEAVAWKNEDIYSHSVTADDGSFDSGLIAPGSTWKMIADRPGTMGYHCKPHPNMMAELVVKSGGQNGDQSSAARLGSLRWTPPRRPEQIHPILVNFTAALLPLAFLSDVVGRLLQRQSLHNAAW
jgi:plastocyanin